MIEIVSECKKLQYLILNKTTSLILYYFYSTLYLYKKIEI